MGFLDRFLSRRNAPAFGLDISSTSVKLVELSRRPSGQFVVERIAAEPLDKGSVVDGQIEKFDEVAESIRRVVAASGTRARQAVLAMPPSAVITKRIMLPAGLREEEMEVQVESEANQYIPFSLDEVSLDFCVLGPSAASPSDVEVLIAASRKDRVQDRQGVAEAAGLTPIVIEVESHAVRLATGRLVAALPRQGKDTLVALFEIGSDATSLKVLKDDVLLYDRDQAFGGSQLTQLISRQYGLSFEEAEHKKRSGELPEDYTQVILEPFVDSLAHEIGRALQYFFTSTPHHKVHYVMLAGGTATLPGLTDRVTELSGFASLVVNPFEDMAFGGSQLTQLISRQYGFSFEEAETKKLSGDLPEDYEGAILSPFVDSLSQEIGRALQYFFTSTPHHKVHYVMLAGGTATLPGLKERVTDLTGFASNVVNPFEHMQLGGAVRESRVRREAPSYLTACGLAMRRFLQ